MPKISLNIGNDLNINENNALEVKVSFDQSNSLTIESDGLYANNNGTKSGLILESPQAYEGIRVGYVSQFVQVTSGYENRVSCDNIIHRVWTCTSSEPDGKNLTGRNTNEPFRSEIDYVLPGDLFRWKNADGNWNYYVITQVTSNGLYPGNSVSSFAKLGTWGDM